VQEVYSLKKLTIATENIKLCNKLMFKMEKQGHIYLYPRKSDCRVRLGQVGSNCVGLCALSWM